ncbi:MAG: 50S ribosomal protein L17 [Patescibacteria group bacterium]|jgi:large subunit ribosomal protein L17
MNHNRKGTVLGREKGHRKALLRNLAQSVILYETVNTTLAKAKAVRPLVEKLITTGRTKTLVTRRKLASVLFIESAVNKVLEELGPRYAKREGGYTRIIKLGTRAGDGAEIAQLQLIKE